MVVLTVDAILFDMDGTLVDSTPGILGAWAQFGKDYPFLNVAEILESSHGVRSIDTLRRWLRLDDEEKLEAEVTRFEAEVIRCGLVLLPGLNEGQTEERPGWTIVTSATRWYAPQALKSVGIPLPKHMVMAEDVERGKPNPDPYLEGAKNCHVDPKNCLVVEDAVAGLRAGKAAGAKVLGVCTSAPRSTVEKGEPDFIVENLTKVSVRWVGEKIEVTINTESIPSGHIVSPSFQLCLVETGECGDTVWPNVKKSPNNQYTITMKIPDIGSDNEFFIRMEDNHGRVFDTPEFKLQATSADSPSGDKSMSPVPPNSFADSKGSNSSPSGSSSAGKSSSYSWKADGEDQRRPQAEHEGNESPMKASGDSPKNSSSTMPGIITSTNATSTIATSSTSSLTSAPSVTGNALVGTSGGNTPSTAAIVVPLALFAAALVGLIFSLRQRSKSKDNQARAQALSNASREEPTLKQVTTRESFASGSSGNSGTDLERAMEFITRVKAADSPRLTQLPPDLETKRRARRERRMREAQQNSRAGDGPLGQANVAVSPSAPNLQQYGRQDIPSVIQDSTPQVHSSSSTAIAAMEAPQTGPYVVYQGGPYGIPRVPAYQLPPIPHAEPLPAIDPLAHVTLVHPGAPQATVSPPATGFPPVNMPRPPLFTRPQTFPMSVSLPALTPIDPRHNLLSAPTTALTEVQLAPGHPSSLQPQAPVFPSLQAVHHYEAPLPHPHAQDTQPQLQLTPNTYSAGPEIPYSTRPRPQSQPQAYGMPNPYEAIVKALGTPRPG